MCCCRPNRSGFTYATVGAFVDAQVAGALKLPAGVTPLMIARGRQIRRFVQSGE